MSDRFAPRDRCSRCGALLLSILVAGAAPIGTATRADTGPAVAKTPPPAAAVQRIRSLSVTGNTRIKASAIVKASGLRSGDVYSREAADRALRNLYATEEFADVVFRVSGSDELVVEVREHPIIRGIYYEGNSAIRDDRLSALPSLQPGNTFTRAQARLQAARLIELYRRIGRFAVTVEPKVVMRPGNEVDLVFEIIENPTAYVRNIIILGNEQISDAEIRGIFATKVTTLRHLADGMVTYNPDTLAKDQQALIGLYRSRGFPKFRLISAVAELTADRRDFIIVYVVEEGPRAP